MQDTPDVCVVGAGPAGLATALSLGAAGRRVILLESGRHDLSHHAQALNDGDHEGAAYAGLGHTRHRQVGGTANIWDVEVEHEQGAKYMPLSPCDLVDWPIGFDDLVPYYVKAQALCGLGPFEYDAEHWTTAGRMPFLLEGIGLASRIYQFGTAEQFSRILVDRLRRMDNVTLASSMTVTGLAVKQGTRRLVGIQAVDCGGEAHELRPRHVVLACGAVENARLLLLAGLERACNLPWLGRGFMEHARDFSLVLVPASPALFEAAAFYDLHRAADGTVIGGRLALTDEAVSSLGLPNASITLVPRLRKETRHGRLARLLRAFTHRGEAPRQRRYGWSEVRSPASAFDAFRLVVNFEQRPQPANRIELGERKDRFGNPLPRLVLRWSEEEQAQLEKLRRQLAAWFRSANLGQLQITEGRPPDLSAHHHAGTTRMATSPRDGVVDADGRVFSCENLYVTGASTFPTAGFANPTLTVVALALRLAHHLDARLEARRPNTTPA